MEKKNFKDDLGRMRNKIPRKPLFDGVWRDNDYNVLYESFKENLKQDNGYENRKKSIEDELNLEMKEIKMNNEKMGDNINTLSDKKNEIKMNNEKIDIEKYI